MKARLFREKKFYIVLLWLVFTTAFALWWMKLGFGHVSLLAELLPEQSEHWAAQRRMLLWEGVAWITLLVCGGLGLIYFMTRETLHFEKLKTFFASFNHDVKTSLASLRLQAEALKEDVAQTNLNTAVLDRLISDTMRLQVQIENSLYLGAASSSQVYLEEVSLRKMIESAQMRWPQVQIHFSQDAWVMADQRALTTILNNLIQNARVHGGATIIEFQVRPAGDQQVEIAFGDNGKGFSGERKRLGELFHRPTSKSGSGLGLYICQDLLKKMNGRFYLTPSETGFRGGFILKGRV